MVPRSTVGPRSFGFRYALRSAPVALAACAVLLSSASATAQQQPGEPPHAPEGGGSAPEAASEPAPGEPAPQPAAPSAPAPAAQPPEEDLLGPEPEPVGRPAIQPARDEAELVQQGRERPTADGSIGARPTDVYSEEWWSHTRPIVQLHGYFRTRGELFHNFALNRHDAFGQGGANLWAQPLDNSFTDRNGQRHAVLLCGEPSPTGELGECHDKSQATANLRLRLSPEIHISDNLRILSQIDLLDNLVLGSTPNAYAMRPSGAGYGPAGVNPYAPLGAFSTTQGPPTAGVNGYRNSIDVKRAWAEYLTPLGQLRFGRMPSHWGLGMVLNSGDCLDCDYQTNSDRIMFVTGLKALDLYFGGSWDFVSTGPTNANAYDVYGGQPHNTANLANVAQWSAFAARRTNPEMQRLKLARGEAVLNGGLYAMYRKQLIDVPAGQTPATFDHVNAPNNGFERRGAEAFIPDVWVQLLFGKLRLEAELATVWGSIESSPARSDLNDPLKVRMWGLATQAEFRAVEDKLRLQFGHGWASGDPNVEGLAPGEDGLQRRLGDGAMSSFQFHPAYYVDTIFFRRILTRVQNAYYFRPSVEYDFVRNPNGEKFGGGAAIIWSRASEFVQAPGNKRDLGVELNAQLYYQSKDGSLNDDPDKTGGFYAALQYGVFFPLGGLDYLPGEEAAAPGLDWSLSTAQTVRLLLGVQF